MQSNILWGGVKVSTGSKVCEGQFCPRTGVIPVPTVIVRMRKEIKAAFLRAPVKGRVFFAARNTFRAVGAVQDACRAAS